MVADEVNEQVTNVVKAIQRNGCPKVVMVVTRLDDAGLLAAVEAGVSGLLRRHEAQPERLVAAVQAAAAGDGTVPPDLLGRLLDQVGRCSARCSCPAGSDVLRAERARDPVLRLVADGLDTAEIADHLCYSERTVKNIIHDVTTRLQLRNRSHAVAYALREGLI